MDTDEMYEYNHFQKRLNGLIMFGIIFVVSYFLIFFVLKYRNGDVAGAEIVKSFFTFLAGELKNFKLLGIFLVGLIGGLFFVPTPLEAVFIAYIGYGQNIPLIFILYLFGITISYTINLLVGYRFSNISRKLVSTKQFYKIKRWINKFGKYAVFISNAIPFAPSQQVALIVGVFKYNKYKFWVQFVAGQVLKLFGLIGFVLLFK